jgi:tRNA G46 methylase TrmB
VNGASAPVTSRQTSVHSSLEANVRKHAQTAWLKPVAGHSKAAFEALANEVEAWPGPLVLDTGCGTGLSTAVLALRHPDCLVLGIDKSVARLDRHAGLLPGNARLVRMDLEDLWLQAAPAGWRFQRQCFFYPNPWPKPAQRLRRWPFHPVLPVALACGGVWEVRTNWEVYAREFALAFSVLTGRTPTVEPWRPEEPETLFERKYLASGHALWRWEEPSGPAAGPGR